MGGYKIAVCAITKNEAKNAEEWYKNMSEADEVYVLDTGSTDETGYILADLGAKVFTAPMACDISADNCFRFDKARNLLLGCVPGDVDIVVTTDLDERFSEGWRDALEAGWAPEATHARYLFNWSFYPNGQPKQQLWYYRINARKGLKWRGALHEYPTFDRPEKHVFIPNLTLNHYPDATKPRDFYLELSKVNAKENPGDPRVQFFLGRDYYDAGWRRECVKQTERFLALERTPETVEMRADGMKYAGTACFKLGDFDGAYRWFENAIREYPKSPDVYFHFAKAAVSRSDWGMAYMCATTALKLSGFKSAAIPNNNYAGDCGIYDLAASGAAGIGLYKEALAYAEIVAKALPDSKSAKRNVKRLKVLAAKF